MVKVTAITKKNQSLVDRFVKANAAYDALVNQCLDCTSKGFRAYDKAAELWEELPKREQANICKHIDGVKGAY